LWGINISVERPAQLVRRVSLPEQVTATVTNGNWVMHNIAPSVAARSTLGSGAIWRMTVNRATLLNETNTTSSPFFLENGKRDLRICHQNVGRLSLFRKNISLSNVAPCGYDKSANEGTVKLGAIFHISPKIGGRGDESNHGIFLHHTPNCS